MKIYPSEKQTQNLILHWLRLNSIFAWRQNSIGRFDQKRKCYIKPQGLGYIRGIPDICGVLPGGYWICIEVKSHRGKVSPEQAAFLMTMKETGACAILAYSLEDVIRELNAWYQRTPMSEDKRQQFSML